MWLEVSKRLGDSGWYHLDGGDGADDCEVVALPYHSGDATACHYALLDDGDDGDDC